MEILNSTLSQKERDRVATYLLPLNLPFYECSGGSCRTDRPIDVGGYLIYFVICQHGGKEEVVYIGSTGNLANRWPNHGIRRYLPRPVRLGYLRLPNLEGSRDMCALERALLRRFRPRFNEAHIDPPLYEQRRARRAGRLFAT